MTSYGVTVRMWSDRTSEEQYVPDHLIHQHKPRENGLVGGGESNGYGQPGLQGLQSVSAEQLDSHHHLLPGEHAMLHPAHFGSDQVVSESCCSLGHGLGGVPRGRGGRIPALLPSDIDRIPALLPSAIDSIRALLPSDIDRIPALLPSDIDSIPALLPSDIDSIRALLPSDIERIPALLPSDIDRIPALLPSDKDSIRALLT